MKRKALIAVVSLGLAGAPETGVGQELTGDVKLACEAILCLSSGVQPAACAASLARYFGISYRLLSDTIRGRINFLSLCPVVGGDSGGADMRGLVEAIGNGAGFCTAEYLNSAAVQVEVRDCPAGALGFVGSPGDGVPVTRAVVGYAPAGVPASVDWLDTSGTSYQPNYQDGTDGCVSRNIAVVASQLPSYCASYTANPLTYGLGLRYSGHPLLGGQWSSGR